MPVCIIGMHRTGTSMVARLLNLCGLDLGPPEELLGPHESNLLGHSEHKGFVEINDALLSHLGGSWDNPPPLKEGWERALALEPVAEKARALLSNFSSSPRWGWKDPRTTILLPFWKSLIPDLRFVICIRSPLEVAQSLARRDGTSLENGGYLWDLYMRAAIRDTEGCPRLFTFYEDFFTDELGEAGRVVEFCQLPKPDDERILRDAVSSGLRHHTAETLQLLNDDSFPTRYKLAYIGLRALSMQTFVSSTSGRTREDLISEDVSAFSRLIEEFYDHEKMDQLQSTQMELRRQLASVRQNAKEKDKLIAELNFQMLAIQRTVGWKTLERLRRIQDRLMPAGSRRLNAYWTLRRVVEVLLDEPPRAFLIKTGYKIRQALRGEGILVKTPPQGFTLDLNAQYQVWLQQHRITPQEIARKKAEVEAFTYTPLISIVTPVYNTDETWLRKAIESVRDQIYPHWELCLINDASPKPHVRGVLDEYASTDPRVRVKHLPQNKGIAEASTHGLSLATGEFVGFLGHDDEISPDALFEVVKRLNEDPNLDLLYSDEDKLELDGRRVEPFFKPDWSPDLLLSMNYITHFSVFRRSLLGEMGGFRRGLDGSQGYDLLLRFTERTDRIAHIPKVLYHWREPPDSAAASTAAKPLAHEAGRRALEEALRRRGHGGWVESILPGRYTVRYRLCGTPLVSIIIPTKDRWQLLQQCLRSIEEKTSYARYEIIILDNDSTEPETVQYLDAIADKWRVYRWPGPFNFSAINNFGAAQARGDYLLFLNNDTQVIHADWLTAMLEQAQRPEVGAVGAKLLYPDGRIQHAGVVLGIGGVAGHAFKNSPCSAPSYFDLADLVRNCSVVTAACMMVPRRVLEEVGGFDERLRVALNDVDLCLRLWQRGHLIVYTPLALLYHHESASRGRLHPSEDERLFRKLWDDRIRRGDPYYNPNLTLSREDWSLSL